MSGFLDPLDVRLMRGPDGLPLLTRDGRQLFQLLARFRYLSEVAGLIDVPAGYVTDFASIPQWALSIFGEIAQEPSVPHDYAYSTHCVNRATADSMLYEACIVDGIPKWKAVGIYAGVRVGGGSRWAPTPQPISTNDQTLAA